MGLRPVQGSKFKVQGSGAGCGDCGRIGAADC